MTAYGWKCLDMDGNVFKCLNIPLTGWKWLRMAKKAGNSWKQQFFLWCSGCSQLVSSNLLGHVLLFVCHCAILLSVNVLRKLGFCVTVLPVCWAGLGPAVGLRKNEPWRTGAAMASAG